MQAISAARVREGTRRTGIFESLAGQIGQCVFKGRLRSGIAACCFSAGTKAGGSLAGNDGKMALLKQKVKSSKARGKSEETGKGAPSKRASRKGPAGKDGVERLRRAADRRVGRDSEKLAELLSEKALQGDLASAKVLVALADGKKPAPAKQESAFKSLIANLAAEPDWKGGEEQGAGNRE